MIVNSRLTHSLIVLLTLTFLFSCSAPPKTSSNTSLYPSVKKIKGEKTQGANKLAENNTEKVWRFAVIPDTQGKPDRWGINRVTLPNGEKTHLGFDVNQDGIFDGNGYKIDVSNYWKPKVILDNDGNPVKVNKRHDFPAGFVHLPIPLIEPLIDKIRQENVDLIVAVGDITDRRTEIEYVQWMKYVAEPLMEDGIGVYPVRGNHELVDGNDWPDYFTSELTPEKVMSVNNVDNAIDSYLPDDYFDQGRKLYSNYPGQLLKPKLATGNVVGYPGLGEFIYYFIHNNTLFIGIDTYFSDLVGVDYQGSWIALYPWLKEVIEKNHDSVDHIYMYGHESFLGKKRPHEYNFSPLNQYYQALMKGKAGIELGVMGRDMGQMGHLQAQAHSSPGLVEKLFNLLNQYNVTYIAGHDHQFSRSIIHPAKGKFSDLGFTQIIAGGSSWKAYNNRYGVHAEWETGLAQDNFTDPKTGTSNAVSFVIVEINGRQVTTTNMRLPVSINEKDMTRGAHWDSGKQGWTIPRKNGDNQFVAGRWQIIDQASSTSDADSRLVNPADNYWFLSRTPDSPGYIGTQAAILEGYNHTFNSYEVFAQDTKNYKANTTKQINANPFNGRYGMAAKKHNIRHRADHLSEYLALSWFVDDSNVTLTDIVLIDGTQNQQGAFKDSTGQLMPKAFSDFYFDKGGKKRSNQTKTLRNDLYNIVDNDSDAMAIAISLSKDIPLEGVTIGYFDSEKQQWIPAVKQECLVNTGYSDDFSITHSGNAEVNQDKCALHMWGYNHNAHAVWGFIHKAGRYALIKQ